jgi:hypothetical protein
MFLSLQTETEELLHPINFTIKFGAKLARLVKDRSEASSS